MDPDEFSSFRGRLDDPVVFINYRGLDSHSYGALLYTVLTHEFGKDLVFLDAESIPAGADSASGSLDRVRSARALLAVIGSSWFSTIDPATRKRRIYNPNDWIRRELAEAFKAGVPVIPVLTDHGKLPHEDWLPLDIAALSRCQYRHLRRREPTTDVARIIGNLISLDQGLAAAARNRGNGFNLPAGGLANTVAGDVPGVLIQTGMIKGDVHVNTSRGQSGDSNLELSAVTFTEDDDRAVFDLKFRNIGGQPAFLHRATIHIHDAVGISRDHMRSLPYSDGLGMAAGQVCVSYTYDVALPCPERAVGNDPELYLSQFVEPSGVDRFHIRLGGFDSRCVYVLHLEIHYDAHRVLTSPTIAIARHLGTIDDIRSDMHHFCDAVREVRAAIDRELISRGLPAPDWNNHPPSSRADLPVNLRSVDGMAAGPDRQLGMYTVNDAFWNPRNSLIERLREIHFFYARVVSITTDAMTDTDTHHALPRVLAQAQTILAQLPTLHAELDTPEMALTMRESPSSSSPRRRR